MLKKTIATTMATNSVAHEHHEEVEDDYVFDKKDVVSEQNQGISFVMATISIIFIKINKESSSNYRAP